MPQGLEAKKAAPGRKNFLCNCIKNWDQKFSDEKNSPIDWQELMNCASHRKNKQDINTENQ
jgi:hypothetical protein